jgi:hypothetical protein
MMMMIIMVEFSKLLGNITIIFVFDNLLHLSFINYIIRINSII